MEKYIQYDIQDFASEPSFIHWVRQSNVEDVAFWDAFRQKNPEKLEQIDAAKKLVELLQFKETAAPKIIEDKIWAGIEASTKSTKIVALKARKSIMRYLIPAGVAAAIALLVFFNLPSTDDFQPNYDSNISTELAMRKTTKLPDGSVVYLNAGSALAFDKANWAKTRRVKLEGEAFFEVEKGNQFLVETANGSVEVLGTSFNVFARAEVLKVICETGKVAVKSEHKETILTPSQNVSIRNGVHSTESASPKTSRSEWRKGVYTFESANLTEVLEDIERAFSVEVSIEEGLQLEKYSGSFRVDKLETALYGITWPLGLKYEIKEKIVLIKK